MFQANLQTLKMNRFHLSAYASLNRHVCNQVGERLNLALRGVEP